MPVNLTPDDVRLLERIPELTYNESENAITGVLAFDLTYEDLDEQLIDQYQIRVDLNDVSHDTGLPKVTETAGRIAGIAKQKGLPYSDLHLNSLNGEMCIAIGPKAREKYPNGFKLQIFIEHLQEHFYWISYFEKHDREPWPAYAHYEEGYWQLFLQDQKKYGEEVKRYFGCRNRSQWHKKVKELRKKYSK